MKKPSPACWSCPWPSPPAGRRVDSVKPAGHGNRTDHRDRPKRPPPAVGTAGKLRGTAYRLYTNTGLYMNQKYDGSHQHNTFYLIKTDCDTATQQKLAEIELQGGGPVAWPPGRHGRLYCFEKYGQGQPHRMVFTSWILPRQCGAPACGRRGLPCMGIDDAALYGWTMPGGKRIIRQGLAPRTR